MTTAMTTGTTANSPPSDDNPFGDPRQRLVALALSSAFLIEALDSTILVTAIPAIAADFGVAPLRVNLAISLYLMAIAAMIPASGWLADRLGARRLFIWSMWGFMAASLLAAFAQSLGMLVGARVLQGVAAALMTPVGRLLLVRSVPRHKLAWAISWMSLPSLIGPVLGPLLGGYIVTYASWQLIFLVKLPFGIAGVIAARRFIPADGLAEKTNPFDFKGFALCALALGAAQLLLDQLVHPFLPPVIATLLAVVLPIAAGWFLWCARQTPRPALELDLLRLRLFRAGIFAGGLGRISFNALPFLLPLQLQLGFGWTAAKAGWFVLVVAGGALLLKPVMPRVLARFGFRKTLVANGVLGGLAMLLIGLWQPGQSEAWLVFVVFAFGVFRSLQFNATNTLLYVDLPKTRLSAGTALGGVGQQLSMGLGITIAAALASQLQDRGDMSAAGAFSAAAIVMALLGMVSGLMFLRLDPNDTPSRPAAASVQKGN